MEWFTSIANLFTGGLTGGILGVIGSIATSWMKAKEKKADQDHELAMRDKDMQLMQAEAESAVKLEQARQATVREQGDADAFTATQVDARMDIPQGMANKTWPWMANLFVFGEFIKGQVRVWLTAMTVGTVVWLALDNMPKDFNLDIGKEMAKSISGMASMAFAWWFGQRQMTK